MGGEFSRLSLLEGLGVRGHQERVPGKSLDKARAESRPGPESWRQDGGSIGIKAKPEVRIGVQGRETSPTRRQG